MAKWKYRPRQIGEQGQGIIVILIVVVIIMVVGTLILLNRKSSVNMNQTSGSSATSSPVAISTSGAGTTRNYGRYFSVVQPANWKTLQAPYTMYAGTIEEVAFQLNPKTIIVLQATKTPYNSALAVFQGYHPVSTSQISIAGRPATRFDFASASDFTYRTRIVVQGSGTAQSYLIDFIGNQQAITDTLVNQVVSSFRTVST